MEPKPLKFCWIIGGLLWLTLASLWWTGTPGFDPAFPIRPELPDVVGAWTGTTPLYCQNENCRKSWLQNQLADAGRCPLCQGRLESVSLEEKSSLPSDVVLVKKVYYDARSNHCISASLVFTGEQRSGIHKPEWCLTGQGWRIAGMREQDVAAGTAPSRQVRVTFLDLKSASRPEGPRQAVFAYWFVSADRELPGQTRRLALMAWDSIVHGVSRRWAYVSILADQSSPSDAVIPRISDFASNLYPALLTGKAASAEPGPQTPLEGPSQ